MPLRGEAERKTYTIQTEIADSVWIARHAILGENCVQKTYRRQAARTQSPSLNRGSSTTWIIRTSRRYGRPSSTQTAAGTSRS